MIVVYAVDNIFQKKLLSWFSFVMCDVILFYSPTDSQSMY
jgi:hypothetical protein